MRRRAGSNPGLVSHSTDAFESETSEVTREALFNAIDNKQIDQVERYLTEKRELIEQCDSKGNSALIHSCTEHLTFKRPDPEMVNVLLHFGADPNQRNNYGKTALHYACRNVPWMFRGGRNDPRIYRTLQTIRDNLTSKEKSARTKIVRKLIRAGGDLRLHDFENKRPYDYVRASTDSKFSKIVIDYLHDQQKSFDRLRSSHKPYKLTEIKPTTFGVTFSLEQPRIKQTGFGAIIDSLGGKMCFAGEASCVPYAQQNSIYDDKSEQKLRFRVLNFTMKRKVWRNTHISYLALGDVAIDDDKIGHTKNYKAERHDLLLAEYKKIASVRHSSILLLMGIDHDVTTSLVRGLLFERVDLGTLEYLLNIGQDLDPFETMDFMHQILNGITFLNESGIIHQTVCPQAIFLCNANTAKLGMLCFARSVDDRSENRESMMIPEKLHRWLAPEVLENGMSFLASDVYGFCVTLYHVLIKSEPFPERKNSKVKNKWREIEVSLDGEFEDHVGASLNLGLKRRIRERKTRLKDLTFHISNFLRTTRQVEQRQAVQESRASMAYLANRTTSICSQQSPVRSTGSSVRSRGSRLSLASQSGQNRDVIKISSKPSSRANSVIVGTQRGGLTSNLPKRAQSVNSRSLKEYSKAVSAKAGPSEMFMKVDANKSLRGYQYSEPNHAQFEAGTSSDEASTTTSITNQYINITARTHAKNYINNELNTTHETEASQEPTPVMTRRIKMSGRHPKGLDKSLFTTTSDQTLLKKQRVGERTQLRTAKTLEDIQNADAAMGRTENAIRDLNRRLLINGGAEPIQTHQTDISMQGNVSNLVNANAIMEQRITSLNTSFNDDSKLFKKPLLPRELKTLSDDKLYHRCSDIEPDEFNFSNISFGQQYPTPKITTTAPRKNQQSKIITKANIEQENPQKSGKNVTINSDMNQEYTISPNHKPIAKGLVTDGENESFYSCENESKNGQISYTVESSDGQYGPREDIGERVFKNVQKQPNVGKIEEELNASSIEGSDTNHMVNTDDDAEDPMKNNKTKKSPLFRSSTEDPHFDNNNSQLLNEVMQSCSRINSVNSVQTPLPTPNATVYESCLDSKNTTGNNMSGDLTGNPENVRNSSDQTQTGSEKLIYKKQIEHQNVIINALDDPIMVATAKFVPRIPDQFGDRRNSFEPGLRSTTVFKGHGFENVDSISDPLISELNETHDGLRDINQFPRITVKSPGPEKPTLRPPKRLPTPTFSNDSGSSSPTLPVEVKLKPITMDIPASTALDLRTPSRLHFKEKVELFRQKEIKNIDNYENVSRPPSQQNQFTKPLLDAQLFKNVATREENVRKDEERKHNLIFTSTPAVDKNPQIVFKKHPHRPPSPSSEVAETIVSSAISGSETSSHGSTFRRVQLKRQQDSIDTANDISHIIEEACSKLDMDASPEVRKKLLIDSALHKTLTETIDFGDDGDIDFDESVVAADRTNISMWEDSMGDEPIMGNVKVAINGSDYQELSTEEDVEEMYSKTDLCNKRNFNETHQISQATKTIDTDDEDIISDGDSDKYSQSSGNFERDYKLVDVDLTSPTLLSPRSPRQLNSSNEEIDEKQNYSQNETKLCQN